VDGDIRIITEDSEGYPPLLREISQPPARLYVRGNLELLLHPRLLAVVGSRKASPYGKWCVTKLLPEAIAAGIPIVSGLAFGIDALAHRVCLKAQQPTVAVLGSGIDDLSIYPKSHISLAHQILTQGGTIVSEYPPGTAGYKGHFPERNRIIAGLCQATIIIQAASRSGSLITARLALEANREVGAVPGAVSDPLSVGTNQLIKDGATPIISPADVAALYGIELTTSTASPTFLSPQALTILGKLTTTPQHIDEIIIASSLPQTTVATVLVELELHDQAQHVGGMRYIKK
jgi:DNA processing protein